MKTTSRSDLKKKLTENRGNSSLEMKLEHFHEKKIIVTISRNIQKQVLIFVQSMYVYCTFKNVILLTFFANV